MQIFIHILLLIAGLFLVVKGGDIFVDSSIDLAKRFKIPTIIVGATIVSIATTLPELIVSTIAAAQGSTGLAVGNAVGSIICNTALISGLSITIVPLTLKDKNNPFKFYLLLFSGLLLLFCSLDMSLTWYESLIFFSIFFIYMGYNLYDASKQIKKEKLAKPVIITEDSLKEEALKEEAEQLAEEENKQLHKQDSKEDKKEESIKSEETEEKENKKPKKMALLVFLFILGAGMIAAGAFALVEGAKYLAIAIGISESFVGLTIVAIGTSLPELITTITAIKKKDTALGYGNVVGANILNVALIMGMCGIISGTKGLGITKYTVMVSIPVMLVMCAIFVLPLILKNKTYRWQGITLLTLYGGYFVFLTVMSILGIPL